MKIKQEVETLRKMSATDLGQEKKTLIIDLANLKAKMSESGKKNSPETKLIKKKIARIETMISEKIDEQVSKTEVKND